MATNRKTYSDNQQTLSDRKILGLSAGAFGLAVGGLALAGLGVYMMRSQRMSGVRSKVRHYAQSGKDAIVDKVQSLRGHSDVSTQDIGSQSRGLNSDSGMSGNDLGNTVGDMSASSGPDDDFIQGTRPNPLEGRVI